MTKLGMMLAFWGSLGAADIKNGMYQTPDKAFTCDVKRTNTYCTYKAKDGLQFYVAAENGTVIKAGHIYEQGHPKQHKGVELPDTFELVDANEAQKWERSHKNSARKMDRAYMQGLYDKVREETIQPENLAITYE